MLNTLEGIAPEKSIKTSQNKHLWSEKLINIKRKKTNMLKKARKTGNQMLYRRCRDLDKMFQKTVIEEKRRKIKKIIYSDKGDQKSFWKAVHLASESENNFIPTSMHLHGRVAVEDSEKLSFLPIIFFER